MENGNMSIREGNGQDLGGSDDDGWGEEERFYTNRRRAGERWNGEGSGLTRGEGEGGKKEI